VNTLGQTHLICSQIWLAGSVVSSGWQAIAMMVLGGLWFAVYVCLHFAPQSEGKP
jgi:hypothetical protein